MSIFPLLNVLIFLFIENQTLQSKIMKTNLFLNFFKDVFLLSSLRSNYLQTMKYGVNNEISEAMSAEYKKIK